MYWSISSYRNIEIDEDTVELLTWFRRIQQKMIMKHKEFKRNRDMIIFQTYNGNYMTPSTIRETLLGLCFNAGVEYKGTHAFRHTHAVLGYESGELNKIAIHLNANMEKMWKNDSQKS